MPSSAARRSPPGRSRLKRKAFFVDERSLRRTRRALAARSDAEAVRLAVERVAEMEELARFMAATRGVLGPDSFDV